MSRSSISRRFSMPLCAPALLAGLVILAACDGPENTRTTADPKRDQDRCGTLLDNALLMVHPDRLGIRGDVPTVRTRWNNWLTECAGKPSADDAVDAEAQKLLGRVLSGERIETLVTGRFNERDVKHLRNCLLFKQINNAVLQTAETDVERAVRLFYYTVRIIELSAAADDVPLPPFRILLLGRGTAADRAWIFASLLRQLRIDCVIIRPQTTADGAKAKPAGGRWLVGVLLNGGVNLFDPALGLPIPAKDDDPSTILVERPATLQQFLKDPGIAAALDLPGRPYPLKPADLKRVRIEVIGHHSEWTWRMKRLQQSLSGDRAVIVCDPLSDSDVGEGLTSRVANSPGVSWSRQDVGVWPWPESRWRAFESPTDQQKQALRPLNALMLAPRSIEVDKQDRVRVGGTTARMLKMRIKQLLGDQVTALRGYLNIRIGMEAQLSKQQRDHIPASVQALHARAVRQASLWSGMCQFDLQNYNAAQETFDRYLTKNVASTRKSGSLGCYLRGLCLARLGKFKAGMFQIAKFPESNPQSHGNLFLARRWQKLGRRGEK